MSCSGLIGGLDEVLQLRGELGPPLAQQLHRGAGRKDGRQGQAGWLVGALLVNFAVIVPFTLLAWVWTALLAVRMWRVGAASEAEPG